MFRRFLRLVFNPVTLTATGILVLGVFLTLTYFWFEFSDRIDSVLRGEVFTSTAGIYSAPKTLKTGENLTPEELKEYLTSAGYIEKNQQADESRSRFSEKKGGIEIEPGNTGIIDDKQVYPAVSVKFKKDGKSVESITDTASEKELKEVQLEPRILSSLAAEGDGKRKVVTFKDLPPHLIKAITVTEDRAFFEHYGVNFRGIGRALWRRYDGENDDSPIANQGGSSITQQLVKNLLLNRDQTLERKVKEAYMSIILETRLTKEEIFTLYANQIYLGQQTGLAIYGVGQAANSYFGKDVSELTLPEAAFIAGIIRSPNRYNPYKNPQKVKERRNQVLDSMVEAGAISPNEGLMAKDEPLEVRKISSGKDLLGMPYFTQFAVEEVPKIINDPEALQHLRVYTTIDPDLQRKAYEIVNKRLDKLDKYFPKRKKGSLQASLVAIKPKTGEVVAMVGGRDYLETQFNRATDAKRQPGSVFKPFVYATAINTAYDPSARVLTAASIFKDEKKVFTYGQESYSPNNYGDTFSGKELTLRDALTKSKNVITVDLGMELNIGKVMNLAAKAGLPKVPKAYPSMALGTSEATPLQMATAYTVFANLGDKVSPLAINRVTTGEGKTVTIPTPEKKNVLHSDVAYIMNDMMKDVINRGTAYEAQSWGFKNVPGKTGYAGKTGTSRDGWFAGFTPEIVCVVYVGFDDGSDLGMKGSDSAMPIWADFMREALNQHPEWKGDWRMPDSIRKAEIDIRNGKLIRELSGDQTDSNQPQPSPTVAVPEEHSEFEDEFPDETVEKKEIYVTEVPPEFRRVELFISGTIPNRSLLSPEDEESGEGENGPGPNGSPTPFTTWEEENHRRENQPRPGPSDRSEEPEKNVSVLVCEFTGMKAGEFCPKKRRKTFKESEQPKEICSFHIYPPN
ncbi:MAG: PBP1A family penicillin-binding protein [Pyrinomonadaceae bacterium]